MISFIVIGKNEGWRLTKCLQSIIRIVDQLDFKDYEIIYVDSNSSDFSISNVSKFNCVKIFQITGICNSAIARNIGAKESTGDKLFFIDGDMEISLNFFRKYLNDNIKYEYEYFTGQVLDYIYSDNWEFIKTKNHYTSITTTQKVQSTGGVFIITRKLWFDFQGMDSKFKRSQDLDFSLRLARKGNQVVRVPDVICHHHTIPHSSKKRMWRNLYTLDLFYNKSVLTRKHFFNKCYLGNFLRNDYSIVLLVIMILSALAFHSYIPFLLYLFVIFLRAFINSYKNYFSLFYFTNRILYHIVKDFFSIIMFFSFFPKDIEEEYKRIR